MQNAYLLFIYRCALVSYYHVAIAIINNNILFLLFIYNVRQIYSFHVNIPVSAVFVAIMKVKRLFVSKPKKSVSNLIGNATSSQSKIFNVKYGFFLLLYKIIVYLCL